MSAIQDVTRYLRDLDKVAAALESAETSAVGIYLANGRTHGLPAMDTLHSQIRALRIAVDRSVTMAEIKLKRIESKERD